MSSSAKKLTLVSSDGVSFKVDTRIIDMCGTLKDMLEDKSDVTLENVDLPTISSVVLRAIIDYAEHFNFIKDPKITFPLPSNNLSAVLTDPWEV